MHSSILADGWLDNKIEVLNVKYDFQIEELFYERFGPSFPSLEEISSHSAYTLLNSEPLIDYAVPTLSRVVNIGGIGARKPSPVNKVSSLELLVN